MTTTGDVLAPGDVLPAIPRVDSSADRGARRGRSVDPTIRQRWRRIRVLVAAGLAVVIGAVIVALGGRTHGGDLDPRSFEPSGSHAISALLSQRNVHVGTETDPTTAANRAVSGTTLVLVRPDLLSADELRIVSATPADLVVIGARLPELQGLGLPVGEGITSGRVLRDPSCSLPAATAAGNAELPGDGYTVPAGGVGCYPDLDSFAVVTFAAGPQGRHVTLVSDGRPFTNSAVGHVGNAALALGLLDPHPDVVWLVPHHVAPVSGSTGQASVTDLLPDRLKAASLQLVIAVVVIALWRGRRLGRLVPEDVPVIVRQSETVRGRSRLYRRSRSLDRASDELRQGTRHRLGSRLGLGPRPVPAALVDAIAHRAQSSAVDVDALLYGSTPADERALVALAQALTALEQEVLRT